MKPDPQSKEETLNLSPVQQLAQERVGAAMRCQNEFRSWVKAEIQKQEVTISLLADITKINASNLGKLLREDGTDWSPSLASMIRIAAALGYRLDLSFTADEEGDK